MKRKRRERSFLWIAAFFVLLAVAAVYEMQTQMLRLGVEAAELQRQIVQLRIEQEELEQELEYEQSVPVLDRYAREVLGLQEGRSDQLRILPEIES